MSHAGLTSIIVPTRDRVSLVEQLVDSLRATLDPVATRCELLVVDNQSVEPATIAYFDRLKRGVSTPEFERVRVLRYDRPFNYSAINNIASLYAKGDALLFLNNDVEAIHPGWLVAMREALEPRDIGAVGAKLYYSDDTVQHAGITLGHERIAGHAFKYRSRGYVGPDETLMKAREVSAVTGACLLMKSAVFGEVGGFDTQLAVAFNDVDLCLRVGEAGYRVIWTPAAELYHHESISRKRHADRSYWQRLQHRREIRYMERKWGDRLSRDPFALPAATGALLGSSEYRSEGVSTHPESLAAIPHSGSSTTGSQGAVALAPTRHHDQRDTPGEEPLRPTVAVAVCTHNGATFLERQLRSLAEQTWPVSIVVFDDASSDDTCDIVRQFAETYPVELVCHDENVGFVDNYERAVQVLSGREHSYIALCDQDDVWKPNRVELQMRRLLRIERLWGTDHPILVHSDLEVIDADDVLQHRSFLTGRGYAVGSTRNLSRILGQNGVMGNTILMNRALAILSLPFPAGLHAHDYWFAILAELYGHRLFVNRALVRYRIHDANTSNRRAKFGARSGLTARSSLTIDKARRRDFKLPFREDSRAGVLEALLAGDGRRPQLSHGQRRVVERFLAYLRDDGPRIQTLYRMIGSPFLRPQWSHRMRFAAALLTTRRYLEPQARRRRRGRSPTGRSRA